MAIGMTTTLRNDRLQKIIDAIDAGAGAGTLKIYNGTRPATGGTATTLLATLTFSDPCAPAPASGVLTFSAITADASADASGTATWARVESSTPTFVMDLSVGVAGSGADVELFDITIDQFATVGVSGAFITEGNP
jgi:hypothetical protein